MTEKSALITLLLSKSRKNGHKKIENRITNKTFTPKNDLDYRFFHCGNVSKGCNHFLGEKVSAVCFHYYYFKCCNTMLTYPCSENSIEPTYK